jgi:uncharacterized protein YhaN
MKIVRLKLLAFGPFTDKPLELGAGHEGLHIVYGPNEAGKSSALRALRQMLYGIPERSSDDFIHPYARIRIGGVLRRSDGTVLEFVRRKGRINTLRGPDDETLIDESHLQAFLGGVDADLFATMFGIDHADLVGGGEEIIQGGGNIGQVLFAAGSGISDLRKIQAELQAEADNLFKPLAQKPRINEAVAAFKKSQKEIREAQLPDQEWVRHDQALREALKRKRSIDCDLERKMRERQRLERIKEALPAIGRRKELLKNLETYADAPTLPPDFGERRRNFLTSLKIARTEETQTLQSLEEISKGLEKLVVPGPLLEHAKLIGQLQQDLGSHLKAKKDRSTLWTQQGGLEEEAKAILRELRSDFTLDQAEELRLGKAESIRIQELGGTHERLKTRLETTQKEIGKLSPRVAHLKERLGRSEDPPETGELRKAIEHAQQQGRLEENYRNELREIERTQEVVQMALKKQTLWHGSLEEIKKLPIPSLETVDTFEARLGDAKAAVEKHRSGIDEIEQRILQLDGQIEQLRLEQEVPTESELHEARRKREEGWQLVRSAWKGQGVAAEHERDFVAAFPPAKDLAEAYEYSVKQADDIGDRLRREADRVNKQASFLAERETRKTLRVHLKRQLETAENNLARIQGEWSAQWEAIGVLPQSPREMRVWVQNQKALADQVSNIRERKAKAEDAKAQIEIHRGELSVCLEALGEPPAGKDERLSHLVRRGQRVVDRLDRIRSDRAEVSRELEQRSEELRDAGSRVQNAEQELSEWRFKWGEAIKPLGLEANASPGQANAVMQDIKSLLDKLKEAKGYGRRIYGIDKDAEDFFEEVRSLAERVAPDLMELPVEQSGAELSARLMRGKTATAQKQGLEKQRRKEQDKLWKTRSRLAEIGAQMESMCDEAGCNSIEELAEAEERSDSRRKIETELEQLEAQLRKLSAGATLDEFVREAQAVDPDSIDPVVNRLTEEIDQLGLHKSDLDRTIGREENELSKMDGNARAAELAEEAQALLARLETDVEQYARLRLASTILNQAIERYREKNQGPILERSNELFARMTLGSFNGLRVDFNDKGEAVLVGVRPGGKEVVTVEGMSDGTTDQLYLAVRLASLDAYMQRNEAMPFIVDDILIKFDDERATAALQVLAEISRRTQVIFFTHHKRLVELAEAHVEEEMLFTHFLNE